jgi:hypothetical protein
MMTLWTILMVLLKWWLQWEESVGEELAATIDSEKRHSMSESIIISHSMISVSVEFSVISIRTMGKVPSRKMLSQVCSTEPVFWRS